MRKKLLILLLIILPIIVIPIAANAETYGDLSYEKYDDHIEITDCNKSAISVDIPAQIDGLPVTKIGDGAFQFCENLRGVTLPNSLEKVGMYSFMECTSLTGIDMPESVLNIEPEAFLGCTALKDINLGSHITSIGYSAFHETAYYNNPNNWSDGVLYIDSCLIETVPEKIGSKYIINNGTTCIADMAFEYCSNLIDITIPNGVIGIGGAFYECTGLKSVNIPDTVTDIGDSAFYNCTGLTSVSIGKNVTSIGNEAFAYCKNLKKVNIPDKVTKLGYQAFMYCENLTDISLPASLTDIGREAFFVCESLRNITVSAANPRYYCDDNGVLFCKDKTEDLFYDKYDITLIRYPAGNPKSSYNIPSGVTEIGCGAFDECKNLKRVNIPGTVEWIEEYAFDGSLINHIDIPGSVRLIDDRAFGNCKNLTGVILEDGVRDVMYSVFVGCENLESISLTNSVQTIGDGVFSECAKLKNVYFKGTKDDFKQINLGTENDSFTNANICFDTNTIGVQLRFENDITTAEINLDQLDEKLDKQNAEVYVGLYDSNGVLTDGFSGVFKGENITGTLKVDSDSDHIKVFVWNKDGGLEPLTYVPEYINLAPSAGL